MQGQGRVAGEYFGHGWSCCTRRTNNCVEIFVRSARPHQKEQTQHCPHPREYFGFPGITSFQSSSPGTLRLPLSWWKTIPLLDAGFCGSFPDLFLEQYLYLTHTTPQYSSDDCSQYFIFFLIAFLLQAFVAETQLFWRGSLHNSWKAQHHIASPWMLAFWEEFPSGWDRARKFGLPDTHTFVLNVLRKNTGIEPLDIILNVLFSYYFCTALDFKMLKQDWLC